MLRKPVLLIVSPASRAANNGNWRTADRWSRFLRARYHVDVVTGWTADAPPPDCMFALHARRSAAALASFAEAHPDRARVLVLTGTDLYRDIAVDPSATRSLDLATHLVVLQDAGHEAIDPRHRDKCRVIYQSAPARTAAVRRTRTFDVVLVGHMRAEKDPMTPMRALHASCRRRRRDIAGLARARTVKRGGASRKRKRWSCRASSKAVRT